MHRFFRRSSPLLLLATAVGLALALTACLASGQSTDGVLDDTQGRASYYGGNYAGKTTASGEPFDPEALTAAHPSLPFGTRVRVTRVTGNEQAVTVRINDRGPFTDDRIIDLSRGAARRIDMIEEGVVEVRIEILELPPGASEEGGSEEGSTGGW
jgi:rare lipoprotein A